ncbi:MAG: hypothetical protein AAF196_11695 [Planctomycetota bacterium]
MFADSLWLNLLLFVCGQIAGWSILRSGLVVTGVAVLAVLWIAADLALVLRFVLDDQGAAYLASLWITQLTALGAAAGYFGLRIRTARDSARLAARQDISEIQRLLLRAERDEAVVRLRKLVRRDPWHVAARILLASELRERGKLGAAKRLLQGARRIDDGAYLDLIEAEAKRLPGKGASSTKTMVRTKSRPRTASSARSATERQNVESSGAATGGAGGRSGGTESGADSGVQVESRAKA